MNNLSKNNRLKTGRYRHYKGSEYIVVGTAFHSETEELMVVYYPDYGDKQLWVRPFDMFVESVKTDGQITQRFCFIADN